MAALARWSLKVSRDTDEALRTLLASRGGRRGDLSRFVEAAVSREVVRETVREVRARNTDAAPAEVDALIERELTALRPTFWAEHRR